MAGLYRIKTIVDCLRAALFAGSMALATASPAAIVTPLPAPAAHQTVAPVANPCPRYTQGSQVVTPPALTSSGGKLYVNFSFQQRTDERGRTLYCFMTPDGMQNPTLHVLPGDTMIVALTNNTPQGVNPMTLNPPNCGATFMNSTSVNLHYHGTNTSPQCGGDEVIKTIINSGETFYFQIVFPSDEPPGLYWYHPHVHGISDPTVMGGATGALIVDGIESFFPSVVGLPQQTIVLRDQRQLSNLNEGPGNCGFGVPYRDVTVNNVPVNSYQLSQKVVRFMPASLTVPAGQPQFWRVANASADSILDLSLVYGGVAQTLNLIAIDGVPLNTQDGTGGQGTSVAVSHFRLPPASRVEFVALMPQVGAAARLMTQNINTGADGDCDPTRPLIAISAGPIVSQKLASAPPRLIAEGAGRRFAGLKQATVTAQRTLYFSENANQTEFYMTVQGQTPHVFDPNEPPSIVTSQGAVEQWIVQNQSTENHEFHIHQIHFLVQAQNNFGVEPLAPGILGQYLDTIEVPAWSGNTSDPYPSVTLLMDFRGAVVGQFVFHCHILGHEDLGMMSIIQVNAANGKAAEQKPSSTPAAMSHAMGSMTMAPDPPKTQ